MRPTAPINENGLVRGRWIPSTNAAVIASFAWAMLISTGASHATVIEYDGDGNATVINLVQPEQSEASSDPPVKR